MRKGAGLTRVKSKKNCFDKTGAKHDKKYANKPHANNLVIPSSKIIIPTTSEISLSSASGSGKNGIHFNFSSKGRLSDKRQKSEHNLLSMRINNDLGGVKDYSKIDRKMKNSNSKKELGSIKEFKKSHVNGKAITYREPDPDNVALFDLKKNAIIKNKLHCRKPSKHGIDVSNYEQANTPSSGFFDLKKPGLSKNLSQRKIGDVNNTDIGNYSTVQTKASHKKYLSKKSTLGDTEITRHYKKKSKVSSRNSYINSAKPSNSRKF